MSTSPIKHSQSAPETYASYSQSESNSEPLSRTSTYAKTIPLDDKIIHVVRSPTEGYKLKGVEWVIQGSNKHVLPFGFIAEFVSLSFFANRRIH